MADQKHIDELERRLALAEACIAELKREAGLQGRGFVDDANVSPFRSDETASLTSEEQSRAALQRSEERLDLALEATNLAVYEWDLTSDHLIVNARFREIVGVPSDQAVIGAAVLRTAYILKILCESDLTSNVPWTARRMANLISSTLRPARGNLGA